MYNYWLDPNGELIEVRDCQHNGYANMILTEEFGLRKLHDYMEENHCLYAYEVLHLRGWVRVRCGRQCSPRVQILGGSIDLTKPMRNTINPAMNTKQMKVVKRLCEEYDTEFHVAINDKMFW